MQVEQAERKVKQIDEVEHDADGQHADVPPPGDAVLGLTARTEISE